MHPDRFSKFLFKVKLIALGIAETAVFVAIVAAVAVHAVRFVFAIAAR